MRLPTCQPAPPHPHPSPPRPPAPPAPLPAACAPPPARTLPVKPSLSGSAFLVSCAQRALLPPREVSPRSGRLPSLAESSLRSLFPGQGGNRLLGGRGWPGLGRAGGWGGRRARCSRSRGSLVWPPARHVPGPQCLPALSLGRAEALAPGGLAQRTRCCSTPAELNRLPGCFPQAPI